jgi:hypothetical protein
MNTKIYKMEHQQNDAALLEEAGAIIYERK